MHSELNILEVQNSVCNNIDRNRKYIPFKNDKKAIISVISALIVKTYNSNIPVDELESILISNKKQIIKIIRSDLNKKGINKVREDYYSYFSEETFITLVKTYLSWDKSQIINGVSSKQYLLNAFGGKF